MSEGVILDDIKKMIGPSEIYDHFNTDLIIHINSTFSILNELGIGPEEGFVITEDGNETWDDFLGEQFSLKVFSMVQSYVYFKTRLQFDPPTGTVLELMKEQIKEYEWRLKEAAELMMEKE